MFSLKQPSIVLILLAIFSCDQIQKNNSGFIYQLNELPISLEGELESFTRDDMMVEWKLSCTESGDSIMLSMGIVNNAKDTLYFGAGDMQIETLEGSFISVENLTNNEEVIKPRSSRQLDYFFLPVNNRLLLRKTGNRGTIDSVYFLNNRHFYYQKHQGILNQRVVFKIIDSTYQQLFLPKRKQEAEISFYKIDKAINIKEKLIVHQNKVQEKLEIPGLIQNTTKESIDESKVAESPASIEVLETEILLSGVVIKLNFYKQDGDVYLRSRIVNHGNYPLIITPDQIKISDGFANIEPVIENIFTSDPIDEKGKYLILKGSRLFFELKYTNINNDDFQLDLNPLMYQSTEDALFPFKLLFIKEDLVGL